MRLIDADALMKFLCMAEECSKCPALNKDGVCENGLKPLQMCFAIQTAPTVDAVPVRHARWLVNEKMRWIVCSACGTNVPVVAGWCMDAHINFCPNCGVKMEDGKCD